MKELKKSRKPPGPKPEILRIEALDWKGAVKKSLKKQRPSGGWPKR
jgi:hypothetical protein